MTADVNVGAGSRGERAGQLLSNVSVIVLNYNRADTTLQCVKALLAAPSPLLREIVVVDNGSAPDQLERLRTVVDSGARLIEIGANRYFGEGNNIGAEESTGEFIVFLNNDAFVHEGWLDELASIMVEDETVAAVGPMLCYPDGRVQEVGGLVLPTGDTVQIGKGAVWGPEHYTESFPVDYCSAACLLVPRRFFMHVGGFSYEYEPAYYEDADLCLKLWTQLGRVVVNPRSRVTHLESHTTSDRTLALEGITELNRQKFLTAWRDWLDQRIDRGNLHSTSTTGLARKRATLRGSNSAWVEQRLGEDAEVQVAVYTPYELVPGGGERVLFELCAFLSQLYGYRRVALATPHRYSGIRISQVARTFGYASPIAMPMTWGSLEEGALELSIILGNSVAPPQLGKGDVNIYLCQFPFVAPDHYMEERAGWLERFNEVWVYSEFARRYMSGFARHYRMECPPIRVIYPPAAWTAPATSQPWTERNTILTVGRFFTGGHDKRQDVVIDIVRMLAERGHEFNLALAGSLHTTPESRSRYQSLVEQARGLPCSFYPNASRDQLAQLYGRSAFLIHAAGFDIDRYEFPERLEHFGITPIEAASFGCIPLAFGEGGPIEVISELGISTAFRTREECVEKIVGLTSNPDEAAAISHGLINRASRYSPEAFSERVSQALGALGVSRI